ncbi:MAG TPA: DNA-3-methyladenine glycosylase I, partial [Vitreimonas sp.]|nr:DNA-3-methyladenine glycosylase I [Vitreimonas sp.]
MPLRKFSEIQKLAEKHHGKAGLQKRLAEHYGKPGSLKQSDDRFLAGMAKAVFSAGFSWEVIEKKWPGFEEAFDHFDPHKVAFYADREVA